MYIKFGQNIVQINLSSNAKQFLDIWNMFELGNFFIRNGFVLKDLKIWDFLMCFKVATPKIELGESFEVSTSADFLKSGLSKHTFLRIVIDMLTFSVIVLTFLKFQLFL